MKISRSKNPDGQTLTGHVGWLFLEDLPWAAAWTPPRTSCPGGSRPATRRPDSTCDVREVSEVVGPVERRLPGTGTRGDGELLFCPVPRDARARGLPRRAAPAADRAGL